MFTKTFGTSVAVAVAALVSIARSQIVDIPTALDINIAGGDATCPVTGGAGVTADVLAVVSFDAQVTASQVVPVVGPTGAQVDLGINVCLCLDADVAFSAVDLPVNLDAEVVADVTQLIADGLIVDAAVPGLLGLFQTLPTTVAVTPTTFATCSNCPAGATPICANALCSCQCPTGFTYIAATNTCVLSASATTKRRSVF